MVRITYECPVCWREVIPTSYGTIRGHQNTAGRRCEMSGKPIEDATKLAGGDKPRRAG